MVQVYEQPTPDEAVYLGFGKFGTWKTGDGKKYEHFDAFMALDFSRELEEQLDLKRNETKLTLGAKGTVENHYVRETPVTAAGGHTVNLQLVPSKRASMHQFMSFYNVTLMNPRVLCGLFSGVLLAFLFCSLTMKAVGRAANQMMIECRRQFEKIRQSLRNEGKDEAFVQNPDNWPKRVTVENHQYPD